MSQRPTDRRGRKFAPSNHGVHWSEDEIALLDEMIFSHPIEEIARRLGRSVGAVRAQYNYGKAYAEEKRREAEAAKLKESTKWDGTSAEAMGY